MLCGVWSGSALFASYQIRGLQSSMGYGNRIHLVDFPPFFYKADNFCDFLFAFMYIKSILKRDLL